MTGSHRGWLCGRGGGSVVEGSGVPLMARPQPFPDLGFLRFLDFSCGILCPALVMFRQTVLLLGTILFLTLFFPSNVSWNDTRTTGDNARQLLLRFLARRWRGIPRFLDGGPNRFVPRVVGSERWMISKFQAQLRLGRGLDRRLAS